MIALLAQVVVVLCAVGIGVIVGRKFMGQEGRIFWSSQHERHIAQPEAPSPVRSSSVWSAFGPIVRRAIGEARAVAGRLAKTASHIASQMRPIILKAIRRTQAEFNRQRPIIERRWQTVRTQSAVVARQLGPKINETLRRGKIFGRAALQLAGQALYLSQQAAKNGLGIVRSRIETLSNTIKHIRMRQTEHAQRRRTKEKFLGELMARVEKPADKPVVTSVPQAPSAPPTASMLAKPLQSESNMVPPLPFWSRFKLPHQAQRPKTSSEITASATPSALIVQPSEPENQARMVKILREQEQIILRQIVKHPKDIALYKRLGFVYLELGEHSDAVECFREALKLGSQDPLVRKELQRLAAHAKAH